MHFPARQGNHGIFGARPSGRCDDDNNSVQELDDIWDEDMETCLELIIAADGDTTDTADTNNIMTDNIANSTVDPSNIANLANISGQRRKAIAPSREERPSTRFRKESAKDSPSFPVMSPDAHGPGISLADTIMDSLGELKSPEQFQNAHCLIRELRNRVQCAAFAAREQRVSNALNTVEIRRHENAGCFKGGCCYSVHVFMFGSIPFGAKDETTAKRLLAVLVRLFAEPRPLNTRCNRCNFVSRNQVDLIFHHEGSQCESYNQNTVIPKPHEMFTLGCHPAHIVDEKNIKLMEQSISPSGDVYDILDPSSAPGTVGNIYHAIKLEKDRELNHLRNLEADPLINLFTFVDHKMRFLDDNPHGNPRHQMKPSIIAQLPYLFKMPFILPPGKWVDNAKTRLEEASRNRDGRGNPRLRTSMTEPFV